MKSKYIFYCHFFLLLIYSTLSFSQVTDFQWAVSMGNTPNDRGTALEIDSEGNIYTTGFYQGTVDFNPGTGVNNLTATGSYDLFIQKLDANGNFIWAKSVGGIGSDYPNTLLLDNLGNIYVAGFFENTVDFDPNIGITNLTSNGGYDIFIQKLDTAGNFIWAKNLGSSANDEATSFEIGPSGYLYTTGYFNGLVDFNPNIGIHNLSSNGADDIFIQKLDTAGNFIWAKNIGGPANDVAKDIALDSIGNIYILGTFGDTVDFNPNLGISLKYATGSSPDCFIQKLDTAGNFIWVKSMGHNTSLTSGEDINVFQNQAIYVSGYFGNTVDFNPNAGVFNLSSKGSRDFFIEKIDSAGNFIWAKSIGGQANNDYLLHMDIDKYGNLYTTGHFTDTVDFNPSNDVFNLISTTPIKFNAYIQKLDSAGNFIWAQNIGGPDYEYGNSIKVDQSLNIYTTGVFRNIVDFDPNDPIYNLSSNGAYDVFIMKQQQQKVTGFIFHDFNKNCIKDSIEVGIGNRSLLITPGNIITTTDSKGYWGIHSLSPGTYNVSIDTSGPWSTACLPSSFTVIDSNGFTFTSNIGLYSTSPCPVPDITVHAPVLRPGFSNQKIYVQVCNDHTGTGIMDSSYTIIDLNPLLTVQSSSLPFQSLGNNQYKIILDSIYPGYCSNFWLACEVHQSAVIGQSLCISASLFPIDSCYLDTIPSIRPPEMSPCLSNYDGSHIKINSSCTNDSICFMIYNLGDGDMSCFSQTRLYIDENLIQIDSILLVSGDSSSLYYSGDGRTWRLEVDQHPSYPGISNPSSSIELCGNNNNWTPNLINILPHNDANPTNDIFCGLVTGSFDPNDKTGFPLGVGSSNSIYKNQELEYLIRFQNTGTDTAFTVVIRDTLPIELDIFSVKPGISSHNYSLNMYGPRILEWTFNNIMLPDSNVNELASNGFLKFKVKQQKNLQIGTFIKNSAAIYFDYNAPILTNTYIHSIDSNITPPPSTIDTINLSGCDSIIIDSLVLKQTGNYFYSQNITGPDTLKFISANIFNSSDSSDLYITTCDSFSYNSISYSNTGLYYHTINNTVGCDSTVKLHLTIQNSSNSTLTENVCDSFVAPDNQIYFNSGQYSAIVPNYLGCDSVISINLNIQNSSNSILTENVCDSFVAPDNQIYFNSGQYVAIVPNYLGCDSVIFINLNIDSFPNDSIFLLGTTLSSIQAGLVYQWLNCDSNLAPISGAINQSYSPNSNGNYAVQISNGTCSIISNCLNVTSLQILETINKNNIVLFPNPVHSHLYINNNIPYISEININIINSLGHSIFNQVSQKQTTIINLEGLPSGIYSVLINAEEKMFIEKIIKF